MSTTDALRSALSELAALRESMRLLNEAKARAQAAFNEQHADLIASIAATAAQTLVADEQVRALALTCYDLTGEKKHVEGAAVVIRTTYSYDADEAMRWAETALPTAITRKLDTKAIDKIASTGTLPFAKQISTPSVQIASDLSAFLAVPEPTNVV